MEQIRDTFRTKGRQSRFEMAMVLKPRWTMEDTYNVWRLRETSGENVNRSEQRREFTRLENGASVHGITSANATRFDASAADKPRGELSFAARKSLRAVILADLIKILEN